MKKEALRLINEFNFLTLSRAIFYGFSFGFLFFLLQITYKLQDLLRNVQKLIATSAILFLNHIIL